SLRPGFDATSVPDSVLALLIVEPEFHRFSRRSSPMQMLRKALVVVVLANLAVSPAFAGQQHAVDPGRIAADVDAHVAKQDARRQAIRQALDRPEVQNVARQLGVDLGRARASVDSMSGADLDRAANAALQVNGALAGGASSVTISTTMIIIILLVIILLIVAIK